MMFLPHQIEKAKIFLSCCRDAKLRVSLAESCSGGLLAALLTAIPGSSDVVECGLVTYSNRSKEVLLDVPATLLLRHGAVSNQVALAMVTGLLAKTGAEIGLAITGIAGPGGGSAEKPVGLVHFAAQRQGQEPLSHHLVFPGNRDAVRLSAVDVGLELLSRLFIDS